LNALTKIFIVLLVVCSLLLSAAVVVFVNRVDNYEGASKKIVSDRDAAKASANSLTTRLAEMDTVMRNAQTAAAAREGEMSRDATRLSTQVQELNGKLAQAEKELQIANGTINGTAAVAKAAQEENKGLLALNNDLRTKNDDLLRQNGELNIAVTTKDNQNRALAKNLEFEQERVAEIMGQLKNAPKAGSSEATPTPSSPIAGHVTSVDIIGGKKYATISVGSADNVQKGMKFNVVNSQEFLGFLTVDRVEANEAIGAVEGTKIDKIQKGVDVRTQL
jgi:outer membrane murein-binding lipoprotein Lpp